MKTHAVKYTRKKRLSTMNNDEPHRRHGLDLEHKRERSFLLGESTIIP
jgi:hypothetical protein